MKIFVSHISNESELAQKLKESIKSDFLGMVDVFVSSDKETIEVGEKWLNSIEEALKESEILIVLCSYESIVKPWVNFEAGAAWIRDIPIIPICHSGINLSELPPPLSLLQGISLTDRVGLQKLYEIISKKLNCQMPNTDLKDLQNDLLKIQERYVQTKTESIQIKNPKILCAATPEYNSPSMGLQSDIEILNNCFPDCVKLVKNLTKITLTELLTSEKYDIIHLVVSVDPQNGDILFNAENDRLSATGFARLIEETATNLVVLATCNSLLLAVEVCKHSNMIASETVITGNQVESWASYFYNFLSKGRSLMNSYEISRSMIPNLPIRAIIYKDISYKIEMNS